MYNSYPRLPEQDLVWLSEHTKHSREEIEEMYIGFQNDFPGGLGLTQFTDLFPDLNNGMATANLVFRWDGVLPHWSLLLTDQSVGWRRQRPARIQGISPGHRLSGSEVRRHSGSRLSLRYPSGPLMTNWGGPSKCTTRTTLNMWTLARWRESWRWRNINPKHLISILGIKSIYSMLDGAGVTSHGDPITKARDCFKYFIT